MNKKCECGCGQEAPIAPHSHARKGLVKGKPLRFVLGHNARKPFSYRVDSITGCYIWLGCFRKKSKFGYGVIRRNYKMYPAHRYAWILAKGPIPEGMLVCHHCDNPKCVNVEHLFLGTVQDNVDDMVRKGRVNRKVKPIKLSKEKVLAIRRSYQDGESQKSIASRYGIHQVTVSEVVTRKIWRHV